MSISIIANKDIYLDEKSLLLYEESGNNTKFRTELCIKLNGEKFSDVFDIVGHNINKETREQFDKLAKEYFACELNSKDIEAYKIGELCYIKITNPPPTFQYQKLAQEYVSYKPFGATYDFSILENKNIKNKDSVLLVFHNHPDGPASIMPHIKKDHEELIKNNMKIMDTQTQNSKKDISFNKER